MGLTSALYLGNTALTAAQLAIQVTGNNLANAATPGYSRQVVSLVPMRADGTGRIMVGTGVRVSDVRRQIDEALQTRLYGGISQEADAAQRHGILAQIEATLGELGDNDLSDQLTSFFNSWSERANGTQSSTVVVQQGQQLADFVRHLRSTLGDQRDQIDRQIGVQTSAANGILSQIADLNGAIADAESTAGGAQASTLRDQRDALVGQLSQFMDISTVPQPGGGVNILVGSTPVVIGNQSRGIELRRETRDGRPQVSVNLSADGQRLDIRSGSLGALLANRQGAVDETIDTLDTLAGQLIFEVNKIHATATNAAGLTTASGQLVFGAPDQSRALNDPANTVMAGLPFRPVSGGFEVRVTGPDGSTQTVRIDVDLDGRDAAGAPGFADDTSLEDIRAALDGISGLSATIGPDGKLKIDADAGYNFSFPSDSSGVLGALGVNAYFTGSTAGDIAVRPDLLSTPTLLQTGRYVNGAFVENQAALDLAALQDTSLAALGGASIKGSWIDTVQDLGVRTAGAGAQSQAASTVRQSLEAQRAGISGVSVDEEYVNLITYQRQYQGAAKYISVVDQMTQTLIALV
jgi:flagellar hook-associated protein 1 FlgK